MSFTIENEKIIGELGFDQLPISPNENNGFRPIELFISSLVGCSGTLLRDILTKKRVSFQKITMEATPVRNPHHANRIEKLTFTAQVESDVPLGEEQAEKIANLVVNNCGMIQSVINAIEIIFTIKFSSAKSKH